jgi:hypothetical protein
MEPQDTNRPTWCKSTHSTYGENCVEIALTTDTAIIRDSKNPHGPTLTLPRSTFTAFLHSLH